MAIDASGMQHESCTRKLPLSICRQSKAEFYIKSYMYSNFVESRSSKQYGIPHAFLARSSVVCNEDLPFAREHTLQVVNIMR